MAALYVKEQGSTVQKRGEKIVVTKGSETLLETPVARIEGLAVLGRVQVTTQALQMLFENGVDVTFFTATGKYLGKAGAESSKNIFLRFAQYGVYNDTERRLALARTITANKIDNQITMMRRYRFKFEDYDWKADAAQMERLKSTLSDKQTTNEIMGIEGMCSNIYFGAFGRMFTNGFVFNGRNRRPPRDPINVLISLGYTFLTKEVDMALEAESFETYLGFMHGIRYGRKSLPLDMVEEFRQPVVDRFVVRICNKKMVNELDFDDSGDGIVLCEDGFGKFCKAFERWMTGAIGGVNYRGRIKQQAAMLKRSIMKNEPYIPYSMADLENGSDEENIDVPREL